MLAQHGDELPRRRQRPVAPVAELLPERPVEALRAGVVGGDHAAGAPPEQPGTGVRRPSAPPATPGSVTSVTTSAPLRRCPKSRRNFSPNPAPCELEGLAGSPASGSRGSTEFDPQLSQRWVEVAPETAKRYGYDTDPLGLPDQNRTVIVLGALGE